MEEKRKTEREFKKENIFFKTNTEKDKYNIEEVFSEYVKKKEKEKTIENKKDFVHITLLQGELLRELYCNPRFSKFLSKKEQEELISISSQIGLITDHVEEELLDDIPEEEYIRLIDNICKHLNKIFTEIISIDNIERRRYIEK